MEQPISPNQNVRIVDSGDRSGYSYALCNEFSSYCLEIILRYQPNCRKTNSVSILENLDSFPPNRVSLGRVSNSPYRHEEMTIADLS